jgi:hypothetical protein
MNYILSSLPMYMMSFFRIPKGVLEKLEYYRSRFFWQCDEHKRKYRLAKWSIMCQPKSRGYGNCKPRGPEYLLAKQMVI